MTTLDELFAPAIATVIPDAIDAALLAATRARLEQASSRRYTLLDRGSYDELVPPDSPVLAGVLCGLASRICGRALAIVEVRALRLVPGDYLLAHHDRVTAERDVELVLDLSRASVPGSEVHYRRHGQVFLRLPTVPGSLAVVERGPAVTCNHTYVSKLQPHVIFRFVMLLRGGDLNPA